MTPLPEQMAMYSAYHRDTRNRATHFIGVPLIVFSLMLPLTLVRFGLGDAELSLAMVFSLFVLAYYLALDGLIGVIAVAAFAVMLALAETIAAGQGPAIVWLLFGAAFIGGWIIQLIGHAFEGRKPALLDNLAQIFVAPLFLIAEVLFALGLKSELHRQVEERIAAYLPRNEGARSKAA